jgi:hypothetical protein
MYRHKVLSVLVVAASISIVAYGCSKTDSPPSAPTEPAMTARGVAVLQDSRFQERVAEARRRYRWVAAMHHDVMSEVAHRRSVLPTDKRRDPASVCGIIFSAIKERVLEASDAAGIARMSDAEYTVEVKRAVNTTKLCGGDGRPLDRGRSMSVFATGLYPVLPQSSDDWVPYAEALATAYNGGAPYASSIVPAMNGVLADAYSALSDTSFYKVYMSGEFLLSSAEYWESQGGGGGEGGGGGYEMSIFLPQCGGGRYYGGYAGAGVPVCWSEMSERSSRIAASDHIGFIAGFLTGGPVSGLIWGAAGSASAAL